MNYRSAGLVTPEIESARSLCKEMLPLFEEGSINPLIALETGVANCAARAFVIATILEENGGSPGLFIHRENPFGLLPHVMVLYGGNTIDTSNDPQDIKINPIRPDCSLYADGFAVYGDPALGIARYLEMNPGLSEVTRQDINGAKAIIRSSL